MACVAAAVILFVAVPSNTSAFARLSGHDPSGHKSTDERLRVIDDAIDYGVEHPLTGIGFGRVLDSHSMPAQFFEAGGVVALATLGLWIFGFGRLGRQLIRDPDVPLESRQLAAAMVSGLAAWLITGIISPQVAERFMYVPAGLLPGLLALFERHVSSDDDCLDVGCGDGGTSGGWLHEHAGSYLGVDISESAIEMASARGLDARLIDDAGDLPFPDGSFDLAICT